MNSGALALVVALGIAATGSVHATPPAALRAQPGAAAPGAAGMALLASGATGAAKVALLECASGRRVGAIELPAPLIAEPALAADGRSLYVLAGSRLLRYALPGLREVARVELGYSPRALAVADDADAVVLVGGRGNGALSAHDPATLAEMWRASNNQRFSVSALLSAPARRRFAVAFDNLAEAWEIAWGRDAPPVLQGLVHDYRSNEAVPLPGRFTPRRFELPSPTAALVAGPVPYELARLDVAGRFGIVHLDVRREIERPAAPPGLEATRIAPWRGGGRRGWLLAGAGASEAQVLESVAWRATGRIAVDGEIVALGATDAGVLIAHRATGGLAVTRADVAGGATRVLASGLAAASRPLHFSRGTNGCVALVDRDGGWIAAFDAASPLR